MTQTIREEVLELLGAMVQQSPDIRLGQLLANLSFLGDDLFSQSLREIKDEDFLCVVRQHHKDLAKRSKSEARIVG